MSVPNTFASATSSIPLANLDANFAYYDAGFSISGTAVTFAGSITLTTGTANGVPYLNASKVLTSGSVLTFDGTTLSSTKFAGALNGTVGATTPAAGSFTSVTNSGLTTGQLVYTTTGGLETSSSTLTFNGTNLGLGSVWTTNPFRTTQPLYFQYSAGNSTATITGDGSVASLQVLRFTTAVGGPNITLGKSRGTYAAPTAVASGDTLGQIAFQGYGGTNVRSLAQINAAVDTYTSDTDISGFLTFLTSPSGAASATERMRIDQAGNVGIGGTANASAILDAQSTTKGVRMPNMTTAQKNAIASPAAGLMVFDTTLAKLCVYSGATWQTVTSI